MDGKPRPISTAPRENETSVLLYYPSHSGWIEGWWFSSPKEIDDGWETIIGSIGEPTHWLPIPPTPDHWLPSLESGGSLAMSKDEAVKFPDERSGYAEVSSSDMKTIGERLCINCGGKPMHMSPMAKTYTVVRCPKCEMLYPGDPVQ